MRLSFSLMDTENDYSTVQIALNQLRCVVIHDKRFSKPSIGVINTPPFMRLQTSYHCTDETAVPNHNNMTKLRCSHESGRAKVKKHSLNRKHLLSLNPSLKSHL